ncbi:MAG: peptide chain release factor 2 [Oscillospiraceae bacterium]|nr:peptide chain release factor 2 [Oscillospiraceae bacterium]
MFDGLVFDEYKSELGNILPRLDALEKALDKDGLQQQLVQMDERVNSPGFWDDIEKSGEVLKESTKIKNTLSMLSGLRMLFDDTATLIEFGREEQDGSLADEISENLTKLSEEINAQNLSALLSGEYDSNNVIVTLHAGAGGTEAQDWVEMLHRLYMRWAEKRGFKHKTLDFLDGDEAGLKSVTVLIAGENAYGFLKSESGVHRLVRISPFDSSGRRHTSFASVEVMPEIENDTSIDIRDDDLKIDTFRSGGAGGQHVNKTESAVRITHLPSGIVTACQNERSQVQNKATAMKMLMSKLAEIKARENLERIEDIKGVQREIAWGSQIRSYVFMPYTLVKDHRTDYESGNINAVMDGDIDGFINAYLRQCRMQTPSPSC